MDNIDKIHSRQLARLLAHLNGKGLLTHEIETTLKRSFRFVFDDVKAQYVTDKECCNDDDRLGKAASKDS
jgi:hypothetical protein